jgi:hypothetical protein
MRAWRAARGTSETRQHKRNWTFENICATVGLSPSPQSSLNPDLWPGWARQSAWLGRQSKSDAIEQLYRNGLGTGAIMKRLHVGRATVNGVIRERCRIEAA